MGIGLGLILNRLHHGTGEMGRRSLFSRNNPGFKVLFEGGGHGSVSVYAGFEKITGAAHAGFDGANGG